MKTLLQSLRLLAALTVLTGLIYPALVWVCGQAFFPARANGSLLVRDGRVRGSELLAQGADSPRYVHPRPSAAGYAPVASGASNLPWTSARLHARVAASRAAGEPVELATTSGSGLDPHLPPSAALAQLGRVAEARGWDAEGRARAEAEAWIAANTEGGTISPSHVNVLRLNLALDELDARAR
jgi:K+-transporting ATPase ATPase C chain